MTENKYLCLLTIWGDPGYTSDETVIRVCTKRSDGDFTVDGGLPRYGNGIEVIDSIALGKVAPTGWIDQTTE